MHVARRNLVAGVGNCDLRLVKVLICEAHSTQKRPRGRTTITADELRTTQWRATRFGAHRTTSRVRPDESGFRGPPLPEDHFSSAAS